MKHPKWYRSIGFKTTLSVAVTVIILNGIFGFVALTIQKRHCNENLLRTASQLSETIKKSLQYDMLINRKEDAYRVMDTIADQSGIERVRIYSSEGKIIFSTNKEEFGKMVDQKAEACFGCHSEERPLEKLHTSERNRIFQSPRGYRILAMINPLYNERDCYSSDCHAHPKSQKVLGVIDIAISLEESDKGLVATRNQVILSNALSITLVSIVVLIIFASFVGRPIKELVQGQSKVASGNLEYKIPISKNDEMGFLAHSFNQMTGNLKKANEEITELIRTLELKVDERTIELKEAQSQLLQSEKLAAVGKLAATVAHEINNPLTGVYTYIKLMLRKLEERNADNDPDLLKFRNYLTTMSKEVNRIKTIVQELLEFTRQKEPERKQVDINSIMEESIHLINNELNIKEIKVVKNLNPIPEFLVDPSQIKQVFVNIMVNACEAMDGGGMLTVNSTFSESEKTAIVEITDTGHGLSPENLSKIFEPFFTTKSKGTGLGLSVVFGIISKHNGKIEVESEIEKGTLVRIILPVESGSEAKSKE